MRAAVVGRVDGEHVAGLHRVLMRAHHADHAFAHAAQMHRHVRGVGRQSALSVEHGTGKVLTFLDVDRMGGVGQNRTHLFGDGHEQVVEDFQHDRIGVGADADGLRAVDKTGQHQVG